MNLNVPNKSRSPPLLPLLDICLPNPHVHLSIPPAPVIKAMRGCQNMFPGDQNPATETGPPPRHKRNHEW